MNFKLYDWHNGPYPARVRIAVAELGLQSQCSFESVNLHKGEHKTTSFLRTKNYSGTLPVLEILSGPDSGTLIAECTAITVFLDSLNDSPRLTGTTGREKGIIHMMSRRAELEVLDAISIYFHHATPGLGPHVEVYQNQEWGRYQLDKAIRGMRYFDELLQHQPFVAGQEFTMADITLIGGMIFAELLKVKVPEECQALARWYARMQVRPSVRNWMTMSDVPSAAL